MSGDGILPPQPAALERDLEYSKLIEASRRALDRVAGVPFSLTRAMGAIRSTAVETAQAFRAFNASLDTAILEGSGSGANPTGILNATAKWVRILRRERLRRTLRANGGRRRRKHARGWS